MLNKNTASRRENGKNNSPAPSGPTIIHAPAGQPSSAHAAHLLRISTFKNKFDTPAPTENTWGELLAQITKPLVRAEKNGFALSPATFSEPRRLKEFVTEHSFIGLDLDHQISFAQAVEMARASGFECALYSTHSHKRVTNENPGAEDRIRVIFPLLRPTPTQFINEMRGIAKGWFKDLSDPASDDLARLFFAPGIAFAGAPYQYEILSGKLLDWAALGIRAIWRCADTDLPVTITGEFDTSENQERTFQLAESATGAELGQLLSLAEVEAERRKAALPAAQSLPSRQGLIARAPAPDRARAYVLGALREECEAVVATAHGGRNAQLNKSARNVGGYLHFGVVTRAEMEVGLERATQTCGLWDDDGAAQCRATIKSGLDAGEREPRYLPEEAAQEKGVATASQANQSKPQIDTIVAEALSRIIPAAQLLATDYPEPVFAVHGLLPQGVTFLAGPPKLGKSILSLGLAVAVAEGGKALSALNVERGSVLYLALEDSPRRIQERLFKLTGGKISDRLHVVTTWPRLNEGGLEAIDQWINSKADARLLIVDTLKMLRPLRRGRDTNVYDQDYDAIQPLTEVAAQRVALLMVHHTRKALADDPLATVSGSYGLTGAADGVLVLARSRNRADGTLSVIGRDLEEKELALRFDGALCQWSVIGEAAEVRRSAEREEVLSFLANFGQLATPAEIADGLDKNRPAIRRLLPKMATVGEIKSFGGGKYQLPDYLLPVTAPVTAVTGAKNSGNRALARKTKQDNSLPEGVTAVTAVTAVSQLPQDDCGSASAVNDKTAVTAVTAVTPAQKLLRHIGLQSITGVTGQNGSGNRVTAAVTPDAHLSGEWEEGEI